MSTLPSCAESEKDLTIGLEINEELVVFLKQLGEASVVTTAEERVMDQLTTGGKVLSKTKALTLFAMFVGSTFFIGLLSYLLSPAPSVPAQETSPKRYLPIPNFNSPIDSSESSARKNVRLPRAIIPTQYNVSLFPMLEKGNFSYLGQVSIDLECNEETDRVVLHTNDLVIESQTIKLLDKNNMESMILEKPEYDTELDFLILRLSTHIGIKLRKGKNYTLSMSFVGNLTDGMSGLYRSSYEENGVVKYMIASQMESTDARRVFPCFDEPDMKAVFVISLGRRQDMMTLSNMPKIHTTPMDGVDHFYWDHFSPTPLMSTYLLAFVVAENFTRLVSVQGVFKWNFTTYARPSSMNQMKYATEIGPIIQKYYEDFFQVPFPLPKQDMIAIPDFAAGAMENWGLITFNEAFLLYDEKLSSLEEKEQVTLTIAHELAHQWFGNLVTIDWWTDLWLNEGFATFIEYIGADHVQPEFQFTNQIVTSSIQEAMSLDALESSHPVSVKVNFPSEINEIFDTISYEKGAAIIRMLLNILGEETFKKALTHYLHTYQYKNAIQDNLWDAFEIQAKKVSVFIPTRVRNIMNSWTLQTGFPVVSVKRSGKNITISQERFLLNKKSASAEATSLSWWIYLTYTADFKTNGSTWLAANQSTKIITPEFHIRSDQWIIFNLDETGYYRVNYDLDNWNLIDKQLKSDHAAISTINRAQILDDALNLARANLLDYEVALRLLLYMEKETDYLPWTSMLASLTYIDSMMWQKSSYGLLKSYVNSIVSPVFSSLGLKPKENESYSTRKLRIVLAKWACYYGNQLCVVSAIELYRRWMEDPSNTSIVPVDIKSIVVSTAIREGGENEWNFAFSRYKKSNLANEKSLLLTAMASTREIFLLNRMLEMTLSFSSGIRPQDGPGVLSAISKNYFGRFEAYNFLKENWDQIQSTFSSFDLPVVIQSISASFNSQSNFKDFKEFCEEQPTMNRVIRSVQQSLDRITINVEWMANNYPKIAKWLQHRNNHGTI